MTILPYLKENLAGERKLLASLMVKAVPEKQKSAIEGDLAQAEILASSGQPARIPGRNQQDIFIDGQDAGGYE